VPSLNRSPMNATRDYDDDQCYYKAYMIGAASEE
jgi:hypothetical protein